MRCALCEAFSGKCDLKVMRDELVNNDRRSCDVTERERMAESQNRSKEVVVRLDTINNR
jgi:hypothetical protein